MVAANLAKISVVSASREALGAMDILAITLIFPALHKRGRWLDTLWTKEPNHDDNHNQSIFGGTRMRINSALLCLAGIGSAVIPVSGFTAGFSVAEKDVSSLGSAWAGTAALSENAGVVYANPANMVGLEGDHLSIALHRVDATTDFWDLGSTLTGDTRPSSSAEYYIPNLFYVHELSPDMRLGFAMYSSFAADLNWKDDWIGRYQATDTQITAINLSPSIAYRATPSLTLGASLDMQRLETKLASTTSMFTSDDNWAYSYSLGLAYKASEATRLGLTVHGETRHDISGYVDFTNPATADSDAKMKLHLPETVSLSAAHNVSPALTLLADYTWTRWSRLEELRVAPTNSSPDIVTPYDWRDASRYSFGMRYRVNDRWLARAGFAYDTSPVPNQDRRTPRFPDADSRTYTVGFNYAWTNTDSIDMALGYVDTSLAEIYNTPTSTAPTLLTGLVDTDANFISVQWNHRFR